MVDAIIRPKGQLELLSKSETAVLQSSSGSVYATLFRNCALAVLSTGANSDDGHELLAAHEDFSVELIGSPRGVKLSLRNAPENAFVDGDIIEGIRSHLFAVLRDIVHLQNQVQLWEQQGESITDMVFKTLPERMAGQFPKKPHFSGCAEIRLGKSPAVLKVSRFLRQILGGWVGVDQPTRHNRRVRPEFLTYRSHQGLPATLR